MIAFIIGTIMFILAMIVYILAWYNLTKKR